MVVAECSVLLATMPAVPTAYRSVKHIDVDRCSDVNHNLKDVEMCDGMCRC